MATRRIPPPTDPGDAPDALELAWHQNRTEDNLLGRVVWQLDGPDTQAVAQVMHLHAGTFEVKLLDVRHDSSPFVGVASGTLTTVCAMAEAMVRAYDARQGN